MSEGSARKANLKWLLQYFDVPTRRFFAEEAEVLKNCLVELTQYDRDSVRAEAQAVGRRAGVSGKPPLYFIQAVRRRLAEQRHESRKREPASETVRDIFKRLGGAI